MGDDEPPRVALCRALNPLIERYGAESERILRSTRLVTATPALVTFHQAKLARWGQLLRPEVARRMGSDPDDPTDSRPAALIGAVLACLDAAVAAWVAADGTQPLSSLFDRAVDAIS